LRVACEVLDSQRADGFEEVVPDILRLRPPVCGLLSPVDDGATTRQLCDEKLDRDVEKIGREPR